MDIFKDIIIKEIFPPVTVFSEKGRIDQTDGRICFAISFCTGGQITYTHNGKRSISKPDNAILLPQGATYHLRGDKEGLFPLINFRCENLNVSSFHVFDLENPREFLSVYQKISDDLSAGRRLTAFGMFYKMLADLDGGQNVTSPILTAVQDCIKTNLSDSSLSNGMLADAAGISEVYLRKLFIRHYSVTPKQYILDLRLQTAKKLLSNTRDSITNVAEQCGFSGVYHFCRIFKQKTGCSPSEYAKKNRVYKI